MKGKRVTVLVVWCLIGVFGIVATAFAFYPARVPKTGQTESFGPRDDGKLQKGVPWPVPRFTDNQNGTVTDNLTGLVWLKNASCEKFYDGDAIQFGTFRDWKQALKAANNLGDGFCGLTDGSVPGDWRLPNKNEFSSLFHHGFMGPALPNTEGTGQWKENDPFIGNTIDVPQREFWTSTRLPNKQHVWTVYLYEGGDAYGSTYEKW